MAQSGQMHLDNKRDYKQKKNYGFTRSRWRLWFTQLEPQGSGFQDRFKSYTHVTILEGRVFRPNSTSVFTLVFQHDTNMEGDMGWEAEWNELANKAWVSEARLSGGARMTVQDFWDQCNGNPSPFIVKKSHSSFMNSKTKKKNFSAHMKTLSWLTT